MALIVKKELDNGIILEESYHKVSEAYCTKEKIEFRVAIYKDKWAREQEKKVVEYKNYIYEHNTSDSSKNSIAQAYIYLKTLIEYKDAIDDLDTF